MKLLIALALLTSVACMAADPTSVGQSQTRQIAAELSQGKLPNLAAKADLALDNLVQRALYEMRLSGGQDAEWAGQMESEWVSRYRGSIQRMMESDDIGDHSPLSQWLADFYNRIEASLGVSLCKYLHLSDIKTFNYCIPVVFRPCSFSMDQVQGDRIDEYRRHFDEGAVYYGLVPVVTYWLVDVGCTGGTMGTGLVFFCGMAGNAGEFLMAKTLAPKLSDAVYRASCGS